MAETHIRIFISYSREDADFADRLQADLHARGHDVWGGRLQLEGGRDWADMIDMAIDRCEALIVVLSPDALASERVRTEYGYAQDHGKRIIPLLVRQVPQMPPPLHSLQCIDFQHSYDAGVRELLIALTPTLLVLSTSLTPSGPDQQLELLYRAGEQAKAGGDLERAAVLWEQALAQDPNFQNGALKRLYDRLIKKLRPIRLRRLRKIAAHARSEQDWQQAIGAWRAILDLSPRDSQAQRGLRRDQRQLAMHAHEDVENYLRRELDALKNLKKNFYPGNALIEQKIVAIEQRLRQLKPSVQQANKRRAIIRDRLQTHPMWIYLTSLLAFTALGGAVGILTQQWYGALATTIIVGAACSLIALRKIQSISTMLGVLAISCIGAFALAWFSSQFNYSQPVPSNLWLFPQHTVLIGWQIGVGMLIGAVGGAIAGIMALVFVASHLATSKYYRLPSHAWEKNGISLLMDTLIVGSVAWFIAAIGGSIANWGFGFGYGWEMGLLLAMIPPIIGLACIGGLIGIAWVKSDKEIERRKTKNNEKERSAAP
jgi:tetratricopeptide (TPR) repeat protein